MKSFFTNLFSKSKSDEAKFTEEVIANTEKTPVETILAQMNERRPLPVGMTEFEEWSDRIISGTLLPADNEGMKFALATMVLHLGPTESHKEDAYFIHSIRKSASNQICHAKMTEIKNAAQKRFQEEQAAKAADMIIPAATPVQVVKTDAAVQAAQQSAVTPISSGVTNGQVLGNQKV